MRSPKDTLAVDARAASAGSPRSTHSGRASRMLLISARWSLALLTAALGAEAHAGDVRAFARPIAAAGAQPPPEAPAAAAAPSNYVAVFLGTTLDYRPPGEAWQGWQHDATTLVGYGRQLTPKLALELDLGPTFVSGDYASFALTPGLVWSFHPNVYAAARFAVPVDPEWNLVLLPGIGVCRAFGRVMPTLELNLSSAVGRGDPDLGVTLTAGLLVFF